MGELPSGTVTLLFTDVEGSTRLLDELGASAYAAALAEHRRVLRAAFDRHDGVEVDTQGDAFFVAFPTAVGALSAAGEAQCWLADGPIRVRIGLHTGAPLRTDEGYVGIDVHRAARIAAAGHGGQVLLSASTRAQVDGNGLRDLGEHRLKDLTAPERIWQLGDERFPPLKTLYRTNLPVPATPFLGRAEELREVASLLTRDDVGLVTLTGPGGTGKTRLALQTAAEAAEAFPDGTTWVSLAPLRDPGPVLETIASALDVRADPSRPLAETLVERLAGTRRLLLLDNAEHLLPAIATDVAVLRGAEGVKVLVTSRERLQLQGEHVWPVPPLDRSDGVELFTSRARALDPSFASTPAVSALCERLDDLPLALELAAARTTIFSPDQLLDRLGQRLDLLTGSRDTDPRQHTLRATIAWSYDLLGEDEQRLFRALSVFVGGCTYDEAEAICGAEPDPLQSLLDKSLVRRRNSELGPRYWMLETIREFAADMSATCGEVEAQRRRHAEWLTERAEQAERARNGEEIPPWNPFAWVQDELPNLRAAVEWAFEHDETDVLQRLASSAGSAWLMNGAHSEIQELLARLLEAPVPMAPARRARMLHVLAEIQEAEGDFPAGRALAEQALELFAEAGDGGGVIRTRLTLVLNALDTDEFELARTHLAAARAVPTASDVDRARISLTAATVEGETGAFALAQTLTDEGIALLSAHGRPRSWDSGWLINAGWWALQAGDFTRARSALEAYLDDDSAKNVHGVATAHGNLGLVALHERDQDAAATQFSEQLTLVRGMPVRMTIAEGLYGAAAVAAMDGDGERALRLWGAANALKHEMGMSLSQPEELVVAQFLEPVRAAHTDADRLLAEGASLEVDAAIALALEAA